MPQRQQFAGLGVRTKHGNVVMHRIFHQVIARKRGTGWQTQGLDRPTFGRTIFQSLLHHTAGGLCGNFHLQFGHMAQILP